MPVQTMNPEIEKARKELERLKQRENELQQRLSVMYAAGDKNNYINSSNKHFDSRNSHKNKNSNNNNNNNNNNQEIEKVRCLDGVRKNLGAN